MIEIEREMIRAARAFGPRVARAYGDPRAQYFIEDARAFFARAPHGYDIVVSEPSNPWVSGVASLFTPEFYRLARRSLAPGGLFVQWFQLYEFDRALVRTIMRDVGGVFCDYVLYAANESGHDPGRNRNGADAAHLGCTVRLAGDAVRAGYLDIRTPAQLPCSGSLRVVRMRRCWRRAPRTDYFPFLEFGAARARFLNKSEDGLIALARDPVPVLEMLSGFDPPALAEYSTQGGHRLPRFRDVERARRIANALTTGAAGASDQALPAEDANNLRRVLDVRAGMSVERWNEWFAALFYLSKPLIPDGGAKALLAFLDSPEVTSALRGAPAAIREKVEFLSLVGRRDVERMRADGIRLLATPLKETDPGFHAYTLVGTALACLLTRADGSCDGVYAELDHARRRHPVLELLRAYRAARH